jgi:hypothetical protein
MTLPVGAERTPADRVHEGMGGGVGAEMADVAKGVGPQSVVGHVTICVFPQGAAERAGAPVVADIGPEEGLIVETLIKAERKERPQVGLAGNEVLQGRGQYAGQLTPDVAECLRQAAGQAADLLGRVLTDGTEIVLPLGEVRIESVVQALHEVQDVDKDVRDRDPALVAEIRKKEKEIRPERPQSREIVMLPHGPAQASGIGSRPPGINPLAALRPVPSLGKSLGHVTHDADMDPRPWHAPSPPSA